MKAKFILCSTITVSIMVKMTEVWAKVIVYITGKYECSG